MSEEKKEQTNQEYLQDIVNELLADEEWKLPKELRFLADGNLYLGTFVFIKSRIVRSVDEEENQYGL